MSFQIQISSIRCFFVAAEELHFRRAALRMNVSQPTLSQHVKRLKDLMGVQLFPRFTRRVEFTRAGASQLEQIPVALRHKERDLWPFSLNHGVRADRGAVHHKCTFLRLGI
ncbi:LysR family transcriptional regulator (plasmid) [Agrobacterium larrymoorei]|uniref:LysR family transcriptional regulator n=1 Tax=Agrobacterium larrymoorei TaxID=160699 RepID=A0ABX8TAS0_9HYPH|nr:LysR family transcriptional regulator [Agrobacterium larrymoorei]